MLPSAAKTRTVLCRQLGWATARKECSTVKQRKFSDAHSAVTKIDAFSPMKSNQKSNLYASPIRNTRSRTQRVGLLHQATDMRHRAFVALGSNLGDRVAMIERACNEMDRTGTIKVLRTSSLWETKAMYVLDQEKFVNGVCEVRPYVSS
jgi:hypothetical protein